MSLKDKVVVVTEGAKGIGESTARLFLREGAKVAVLDLDDQASAVVVADAGNRGLFVSCDDKASFITGQAIRRRFGRHDPRQQTRRVTGAQ